LNKELHINYLPIADLIPYANNSRTHTDEQITQIASSIKEFGFTNPVLIDETCGIIAGHGRVMAASKLKYESVPTITLSGLTEYQRKAYVIADNKIALNAGWDDELLKIELSDLKLSDFDIELTGFSDEELSLLMVEPETITEGLTDEDAVPDVGDNAITKLGDIWLCGNHRVMCGDSTSIDDVNSLMVGHKSDMAFTDPPYGVDYKGINNDSRGGLVDLLRGAFSNYLTTSKSGASVYVFHSDRCADIFHAVFREYFHFSSMIIWAKNSLTLSQTDYQSQHEPCLYGWMNNGAHSWYSDRKQTSVWRFDKEKVVGHTTPKPVALVSKAIMNSSKGGDVVTDMFGGSGTTMIASELTGRTSNLMEIDPKYCDVIVKRWQDFTGREAILESTGQKFNELSESCK